uniref:Uncharacterized protein n=1 Tax=Ditylenchus dipsaci TaxID=166011 RepID=A0A915CQ01_9BILA
MAGSILVVSLTTKECNGVLSTFGRSGEMEDDGDEGLHNPENPRRPIVYYHDINGDIILDGRMEYTEIFDVNYPRTWSMCDQDSGLIVCWAKQDESIEVPPAPSHPDVRLNNVLETCNGMQGLMFTTQKSVDGTSSKFRIDTVWNNTYLFDIPEGKKCFNVFLNWRRKRDSNIRWTLNNQMEASISKYIESPDGLALEASLDTNIRIKKSNNASDFVKLEDEEIQMWARTNKYLFTVPFLASGSGPCCNLKAKLMGREYPNATLSGRPS